MGQQQQQQAQAKTTSRRRTAMPNLPFQQQKQKQQQPFQGRQQQQLKQKKKPQQQFGLQSQQPKPFQGGRGVQGVQGVSKQHQQKYRICIDCRCCDCDPAKLKKTVKCGANGLYHLTCTTPCLSCPTKIFKRSYTLPSQVQRAQMSCTTTSQGHCVLEFPLMGEQPQSLGIDLMPVQQIKTPEGKPAFFAQVPILPIMDPAKVNVCIQDGNRLMVKFEHKKTIDCCSRVKYCCEVPLPKKNIDFSSIVCKQNKHTLNITVPIKQQQQAGMAATTMTGYREIPVHRKLRHRKQAVAATGGVKPSTQGQQQKQKQPISSTLLSPSGNIQQQPIIQPKTTPIGGQKPKQKQPQTTGQSTIDNVLMKPYSATTDTTAAAAKKKNKPSSTLPSSGIKKQHEGVRANIKEGVSKSNELLEQVFGFGGKARPSTGSESKDVQQQGRVSPQSSSQVQGGGGSSGLKGDVSKQQQPDIEGSSSTQGQSQIQ